MPQDEDISRLLPRPPHAAPARRDAAIAEALRRFDGGGERPAAAPTRPRKAPLWGRINWPTASALAAAGVAALIALPLALSNMPDMQAPDAPAAPPRQATADASTAPTAGGTPTPTAIAAPAAPLASPPLRSGGGNAPPTAAAPAPSEPAPAASPQAAPAQEPRPAPQTSPMAFAEAADTDADSIVVSGSRIARPELSAANPVAIVAEEDLAESGNDVVVTGSRVRAPARGDWNACTVQDPARNLAACRNQIGRRGPAAPHLSEGLASAWRGDDDQAIAAFNRAIAADPRSALAYLNRALARQRAGDEDGALADLNSAVRLNPRSARLYYHRALLLRERGDLARARADEARAVQLNRAYERLLRTAD